MNTSNPLQTGIPLVGQTVDKILVEVITKAMRLRLRNKRKDGFGGWHKLERCSNSELLTLLEKNLKEGDMIDVINLAAMIHLRTELYGDDA